MSHPLYLDHNATTPLDPQVFAAMEPYLRDRFGNPSSIEHEHGHAASVAVERAREQVADAIGARPTEIVFTGSCTEANNLAILGVARAHPDKRHIVTTSVEHPAIIEPARALEREGWHVTYLPVDEFGQVSVTAVEAAIADDTGLVSVMAANNEVGTIQPVGAIGAICAERGVLFHTDAAQIMACGSIDVGSENIHLASLSAHKAYGPKGAGALYVRSRRPRARLTPIYYGGGQERGLRSGTLNVPALVGMGEALKIASHSASAERDRLARICDAFSRRLQTEVSGTQLNGHPTERLANNLSFSIHGLEPLALMRRLRDRLSFSSSSACATDKVETSYVLRAMFGDTPRARGAFRIAPGRFTTAAEVDTACTLLIEEALRLQNSERPAA